MVTYQEYEAAEDKAKFIAEAMDKHIANSANMMENEEYFNGENPFLKKFANTLTLKGEGGESVPIDLTPTIKIPSAFFALIVGQIVSRLWDNPVHIRGADGQDIFADKVFGEHFVSDVHQIASYAAVHGVCYAFYNLGDIEMFKATEYFPLCDERSGAHRAGIRFWRVADSKPWVVQLYTMHGYIEWQREPGATSMTLVDDSPYIRQVPVGGQGYVETTPVSAGDPYPGFPIVPLYANPLKVSELSLPIKAKINAYDAKETGYMDEALKMKFIMWVFKGYGGDPGKLKAMLRTLQELGIIAGGDLEQTHIEAKTTDIPFQSHGATLDRIEAAIYRDARIMNPALFLSGGITNVAIKAAVQRENTKMVGCEAEARKFIQQLLKLAGVEYEHISFTHKTLVNDLEYVQMLSQGVPDLPFEWRVKLSPAIPQEMANEIISEQAAATVGIDDESFEEFERLLDGQADKQPLDDDGQEIVADI